MFAGGHHLKVLDPVVSTDTVDVVDVLIAGKLATEDVTHDHAVFELVTRGAVWPALASEHLNVSVRGCATATGPKDVALAALSFSGASLRAVNRRAAPVIRATAVLADTLGCGTGRSTLTGVRTEKGGRTTRRSVVRSAADRAYLRPARLAGSRNTSLRAVLSASAFDMVGFRGECLSTVETGTLDGHRDSSSRCRAGAVGRSARLFAASNFTATG